MWNSITNERIHICQPIYFVYNERNMLGISCLGSQYLLPPSSLSPSFLYCSPEVPRNGVASAKKKKKQKKDSFVTTDGMLGKQPPQGHRGWNLITPIKPFKGAQAKHTWSSKDTHTSCWWRRRIINQLTSWESAGLVEDRPLRGVWYLLFTVPAGRACDGITIPIAISQ